MKKVIVDTSVWIDHFRRRNPELLELLHEDRVLSHPMVIGELRCGTLPHPRSKALSTMEGLDQSAAVDVDEVIRLIEDKAIYGLGCGLVDMSLLTSTLKTPDARLWASDKGLAALAKHLGIAHDDLSGRSCAPENLDVTAASPTA